MTLRLALSRFRIETVKTEREMLRVLFTLPLFAVFRIDIKILRKINAHSIEHPGCVEVQYWTFPLSRFMLRTFGKNESQSNIGLCQELADIKCYTLNLYRFQKTEGKINPLVPTAPLVSRLPLLTSIAGVLQEVETNG